MSPATRPRDLARKQFQEAAAATIDLQAEAIATLAKDIQSTREFLAGLSERVDAIRPEIARLHERADVCATVFVTREAVYRETEVLKRGFLGRLRWVFTGK